MKTFEEWYTENYSKVVNLPKEHYETSYIAWKAGRKAEAEAKFKKLNELAEEYDKAKENLSTFYKEYNNWFTDYIKSGKLKVEIK
jgi:hypothetical protein